MSTEALGLVSAGQCPVNGTSVLKVEKKVLSVFPKKSGSLRVSP